MPGLPPKHELSKEYIGEDAMIALKHAKHAQTPALKRRWERIAEAAYAEYIKKVNTQGIGHPGATRRKVFGGRARRRKTRRST
jgi:hypothetical protein